MVWHGPREVDQDREKLDQDREKPALTLDQDREKPWIKMVRICGSSS